MSDDPSKDCAVVASTNKNKKNDEDELSANNNSNNNKQKMPLSRSLTQPQGTIEYVVESSDTITSVAARFHTTPSELARINRRSVHFIFPGQVLYVPKSNHVSSLSTDGGGGLLLARQTSSTEIGVPPNTPNDPKSQSPSSRQQQQSAALPGHAERCSNINATKSTQSQNTNTSDCTSLSSTDCVFSDVTDSNKSIQQQQCNETTAQQNVDDDKPNQQKQQTTTTTTTTIDPADRECLERFLKINVRYITDGQGVVSGVLLVTPNALMFDSNVSDPLVIEHGSDTYNVTVPMDLVLRTALYSDIAHMRVKHAPEAVPAVPKPSVYYASDEDAAGGGIVVEENLKNVYGKLANSITTGFDTIDSKLRCEEDKIHEEDCSNRQSNEERIVKQPSSSSSSSSSLLSMQKEQQQQQQSAKLQQTTNNDVVNVSNKDMNRVSIEVENFVEHENDEEPLSSSTTTNLNTSIDVNSSLDLMMTSMDDGDLGVVVDDNHSVDNIGHQRQKPLSKKPLNTQMAKMTLAERHSAPLQPSSSSSTTSTTNIVDDQCDGNHNTLLEHKTLHTAVSADEAISDSVTIRHSNRLSAAGENRRGQMLKRLSNPVDTIGNLTKSGISSGINATKYGFNATKTGISKGLNATQSGISTGINATKSGLTTTMNVTKTGFNKVLATPKNIMDFSTGLAKRSSTGSKSDMVHLESDVNVIEQTNNYGQQQTTKPVGYYNVVDTKIDAFENFDKLIPRPARVNKDAPLYLCIRMGKFNKEEAKRRMHTLPFGKHRYEREYWFSVPKDKAKNLYHFFEKWAPDIYGDVDDVGICKYRGLEPINTDDEDDMDGDGEEEDEQTKRSHHHHHHHHHHRTISSNSSKCSLDESSSGKGLNSGDTASSSQRQRFWRRSPLHFLKLVEDHFSTEWNVSNSSEEHSFAERYQLDPSNNEPILPELIGSSELLNIDIIQSLMKHLPARAEGYAWTLIYSTMQHGFSLNTLYRDMKQYDSPVLLIVEDTNGAKFGALLSHSLRLSDHFYGTGETFLFTFHSTFECFPWTGENIFFIKGNLDSISIGAGDGNFGLWLDGDLYHGSSHPCKTFGNRTLSSEEDFVVKSIECWGFV